MPSDPSTLVALGIGAVILVWLVFSVVKKLFGLALIAALAFGAYMLWTNPELARQAMAIVGLG